MRWAADDCACIHLQSVGLTAGTVMGVYQMLKGAHYLSHTLVTALVCWLIFLLWRRIFRAHDGAPSTQMSKN
jgi:membrane-associated PAP2 superfamily phosphatase